VFLVLAWINSLPFLFLHLFPDKKKRFTKDGILLPQGNRPDRRYPWHAFDAWKLGDDKDCSGIAVVIIIKMRDWCEIDGQQKINSNDWASTPRLRKALWCENLSLTIPCEKYEEVERILDEHIPFQDFCEVRSQLHPGTMYYAIGLIVWVILAAWLSLSFSPSIKKDTFILLAALLSFITGPGTIVSFFMWLLGNEKNTEQLRVNALLFNCIAFFSLLTLITLSIIVYSLWTLP
jgi:hypothetical protein